eukprot:CAMPEP_0173393306 /NCGR_PEP_ID=MMETSP1356-20130122/22038_1 /TAXON_ID=77927 ORGANISM="Hemiselmis virescens, Strain PCC157" /NCGR_SAMPLE_ID=MMETSP1356 /ASSEMBLY_ACC=CAM_ASM_000847 /LENGTH=71 /DNA_ID=CAMNT_0014351309 /DNA_START=97 /DNA_END=312 /DNA_ORIENTATION=+
MDDGPPPERPGRGDDEAGRDPPGKGDNDQQPARPQAMDVFGGTEGQVVLIVGVLLWMVQRLSTWSNGNCTC